jgi:hypothetical protein
MWPLIANSQTYWKIKSDFFVRDYWRASVENNLLGSGILWTVSGFINGPFARLLKRAAVSPAVVLYTDDLKPRYGATVEGPPCSAIRGISGAGGAARVYLMR